MGHLEFSFAQLGTDIKKENFLDKLLDVFDIENLLPHFAGIGSNIASGITNAEDYLHQNIVCREIKRSNVLINNH